MSANDVPLAHVAELGSKAPLSRSRELAKLAVVDLVEGLARWRLWGTVGWLDIKQRYRRSAIGPFWITLSLAGFVAGLGLVYSAIFNLEISTYLPFLAAGVIVWTFISTLLLEGCTAFISAEGAIKQVPVPLSTHVYRGVWRNLIIFAHNLIVYLLVAVVFGVSVNWATLLAIPGLLMVLANGVGFSVTLGVLSARFRDIPQVVGTLVQLVFFITPILWHADILSSRQWIVDANPFYYLIEIVRQPLLGAQPDGLIWIVALALTLLNLGIATVMYTRYRWRLAYWL